MSGSGRGGVIAALIAGLAGAAIAPESALAAPPFLNAKASATPQSNVHSIAVFGADDRRDLPPGKQSLGRKIGTLTDVRSRSQCTAFCVSEDIVATAGHCLYRTHDEVRPDLANFQFEIHGERGRIEWAGIAGGQSQAGVAEIASGSLALSVKPPIDATRDWALVRLDAPVCRSGGLPLSTRPAASLSQARAAQPVYQAAYHRDFPGGRLAFGPSCGVSRAYETASWETIQTDFYHANDLILHSCDTGGASSGSPLLIDGPNGPEVAGINVGTYVQSRVLMVNGAVAHRYQAESIANTGVSATAFTVALDVLRGATFIKTRSELRELQILLSGAGLFSGPRDGLYGPSSRQAIETFERLQGLPVTGLATVGLLARMRTAAIAKALPPAHALPPAGATPAVVETGSVPGADPLSSKSRSSGLTSSGERKPQH